MNCHFINDNIIAYLEQELSTTDRTLFDNHLAKCETCQHLVTEVQLTYQLAGKGIGVKVSESFVDETISKINKQEARIVPMIFQALKPIAVAASIGLGILIGNGELSMLYSVEYGEEESLVVDITGTADYSVWQSLEEDYGNEE